MTQRTSPAVVLSGVGRVFGRGRHQKVALSNIWLEIEQGEILGLLGPNGAGKTTITKILATLLYPSSGDVEVMDRSLSQYPSLTRRITGVVLGGDRGLYDRLSGVSNLRFFGLLAGLYGSNLRVSIERVVETLNMESFVTSRVETYSKGMRQRLQVAIGIIGNPQVLLLDEPTVGLDPLEAQRLRSAISNIREGYGTTILLTSHQLLDIERLADRIVMLSEGEITGTFTLSEFRRTVGHVATVKVVIRDPDRRSKFVRQAEDAGFVRLPQQDDAAAIIGLPEWAPSTLSKLERYLSQYAIDSFEIEPTTLDSAFVVAAGQTGAGA